MKPLSLDKLKRQSRLAAAAPREWTREEARADFEALLEEIERRKSLASRAAA